MDLPVYEYLVSGKCTGTAVPTDEVPDVLLKFAVEKV